MSVEMNEETAQMRAWLVERKEKTRELIKLAPLVGRAEHVALFEDMVQECERKIAAIDAGNLLVTRKF